jgi:hypothetical protein
MAGVAPWIRLDRLKRHQHWGWPSECANRRYGDVRTGNIMTASHKIISLQGIVRMPYHAVIFHQNATRTIFIKAGV